MSDDITIEGKDCLPFDRDEVTAEVMQHFVSTQTELIFNITSATRMDNDSKLAEYDYRRQNWIAGRFIGEAYFPFNGNNYKVTIKPRFGEQVLLNMLEEIFNIRITKSASQNLKTDEWQHYIKRIMALIWIQKLANANVHGLPKVKVHKTHKGASVKGRMLARKTIIPLYCESKVVSSYVEKTINPVIASILFQAYSILKSDFSLGVINTPDSAEDAVHHICSAGQSSYISNYDFQHIKYNDIYLSWKPIVDFSWDIIQQKRLSLKNKKTKKSGLGFFIDMAEVWEQYLRSILKRRLAPEGWSIVDDRQVAYQGYFFQRELIPDLVFQKGDEIVIWDAKYKRMEGRQIDVDRSDFFQIHTYIQYFVRQKNAVKAGGLLYPLLVKPDLGKYNSPYLLNEHGMAIPFSIDGLEVTENPISDDFLINENKFIDRIIEKLA